MEVTPQDEMANPQGMKVFAVERHRLPEDFVYFRTMCGAQVLPLVFGPNRACVIRYRGRYQEKLCVSDLRFPELSAQVRRQRTCISCNHTQIYASITRTGQNG